MRYLILILYFLIYSADVSAQQKLDPRSSVNMPEPVFMMNSDTSKQQLSPNSFSGNSIQKKALNTYQESPYSTLQYQVHVVGQVSQPGTYRIPASARVAETIELAGGILQNGSLRNIQIKRQSGNVSIDLLSFRINGKLDSNPYLLDNDVIYVPLIGKATRIEGAVARPGSYELLRENRLSDLIQLAGGFTPGYTLSTGLPIKLVRFNNSDKKIIDVPLSDIGSFKVESADIYYVPHLLTKNKEFDYNTPSLPGDHDLFFPSYDGNVYVIGAVASPGLYPFNPYYKMSNYISAAGGATRLAKQKKIKVISSLGKVAKKNIVAEVNPGDTIVVPEKYLPPEGIVNIFLSTVTAALGIMTTILTISR